MEKVQSTPREERWDKENTKTRFGKKEKFLRMSLLRGLDVMGWKGLDISGREQHQVERPKIERAQDTFVVQDDWAMLGKLRMAEVRLKS